MKLSLTLIMKDEQETIKRILDVASRFCDEMIVVDTGSVDQSKLIAKQCGALVFDYEWKNDFAAARNFAISKASGDYAIWLDADDFLTDEECAKLIELKSKNFYGADLVMLKYRLSSDFVYFRERIFRLDGSHFFEGFVHEVMPLKGRVIRADIEVEHRKVKSSGKRNLDIYLSHDSSKFSPRERYYFARELYYNDFYKRAAEELDKFLKVGDFKPNLIDASIIRYRCGLKLESKDIAVLTSALRWGATPQLCCEIGEHFFDECDWKNSIFWYTAAISADDMASEGAFCDQSLKALVPLLQLTVCYYRMDDNDRAKAVAAEAYKLFPIDQRVIYNAKFFKVFDLQADTTEVRN